MNDEHTFLHDNGFELPWSSSYIIGYYYCTARKSYRLSRYRLIRWFQIKYYRKIKNKRLKYK